MNKTYTTKEMVSRVVDKLYQRGERIEIGGNRHAYKRKYHLKYSQLIVRKVLDAFLEEMVTVLSEGNTVKIAEYFKLEPKFYPEWELNSKICGNNLIIPEQYKPKMKLYKRLKEACKLLTKENQHLNEEGA